MFQVEDTGCGISFGELDDLFDAFAQADAGRKSLQGTGLGLTITRKFVRMMGGEIEVESTVGKGSIFSFYIVLDIPKNLDSKLTNSRLTYTRASDFNNEVSHASLLEDLMTMPHAWVLRLNQAANEVDEDLLQIILEELPESKAPLSDSLTGLVKDFRLDIVADSTKQILDKQIEGWV